MEKAIVVKRENTGNGFFTTIAVPADVPQLNTPRVLGCETHAHVHGLEHGLGFVLFMDDGRIHLLDGYARAAENTALLDFLDLTFEISKQRIG